MKAAHSRYRNCVDLITKFMGNLTRFQYVMHFFFFKQNWLRGAAEICISNIFEEKKNVLVLCRYCSLMGVLPLNTKNK